MGKQHGKIGTRLLAKHGTDKRDETLRKSENQSKKGRPLSREPPFFS
jgi:hypothetical protein